MVTDVASLFINVYRYIIYNLYSWKINYLLLFFHVNIIAFQMFGYYFNYVCIDHSSRVKSFMLRGLYSRKNHTYLIQLRISWLVSLVCLLPFPHKKRCSVLLYLQLFVGGFMSLYVMCVCLRIVVANTYCLLFLFWLFSSCVPYVASFSGLSILLAPLVFSNIYFQALLCYLSFQSFDLSASCALTYIRMRSLFNWIFFITGYQEYLCT